MAVPLLIPLLQRLLVWVGGKLLLAFGLSFLTYAGFTVGLNAIRGYVLSNFNSMPSDVFNILMMAGLGQVIGIIFGAFAFNAGLAAAGKLTALKK